MAYLTLATLAKDFNDGLNTVSATLATATTIDREIPFNVVQDIQDYYDDKVYSSTVTVPGIMIRLNGEVAPSQNYQSYSDDVTVTIYSFKRELEDTKKVIDTYIEENTGKFKRSGTWIYQQEFTRPTIIDRGKDEGEDRVTIILDIKYIFVNGGYTSDDLVVKIGTEEIPVLSYTHSMQREMTANDDLSEAGVVKFRPKKGTITKRLSIIYINSTEINKVFQDIDTGEYLTRTYSVFFGIGFDGVSTYDYSNTETMTVSEGTIQVTEGGLMTLDVTLVKYNGLS